MLEITIKAPANEIDHVQRRLLAAFPELDKHPQENGATANGGVRRTFVGKGGKTEGVK